MKITPIEIRQKAFEKVFRGYDREEVDAFLLLLSQEWERVLDQSKENKIKLDIAEREVKKLREVESSLFQTLKAAEDTGSHMIEQANKSAEMHMREAQVKADSIMREARSKAHHMVQDADLRARHTLEEAIKELKSLERDCRTVENQRENLLADLRTIVNDIAERVNRMEGKSSRNFFEKKLEEVKTFLDERGEPPVYLHPSDRDASAQSPEKTAVPEDVPVSQPDRSAKNASFFDEIEGQ